MMQKSHDDRMLWAQFDALEMGSGWDDTDILKPQIMIEVCTATPTPAAPT